MRLSRRDIIATCAVGAAVVLYALWLADATPSAMSGVPATGLVALALGFVASATAVVPSFAELMHGNKGYLACTSALGLAALVAGVVTLWSASGTALAVLMTALVALWLIATWHHGMLAKGARPTPARRHSPSGPGHGAPAR